MSRIGARPQDFTNPAFQMMAQIKPHMAGTGPQSTQQAGKDLGFPGGNAQGGQTNPFFSGGSQGGHHAGGSNPFEGVNFGGANGPKSTVSGMDDPMFQASLAKRTAETGNVAPTMPAQGMGNKLFIHA